MFLLSVCELFNEQEPDDEAGRCFLKTPHLDILMPPLLRAVGAQRSSGNDLKGRVAKLTADAAQCRLRLEETQARLEEVERELGRARKESEEWKSKCKRAEEGSRADATVRDRMCSILADVLLSRQTTSSSSGPTAITATAVAKVAVVLPSDG